MFCEQQDDIDSIESFDVLINRSIVTFLNLNDVYLGSNVKPVDKQPTSLPQAQPIVSGANESKTTTSLSTDHNDSAPKPSALAEVSRFCNFILTSISNYSYCFKVKCH